MSPASVAVVGAGPAGLMAAEVLAAAGAEVTVFELHRSPGRKLLLAGRSGLNLTHAEAFDELVGRYRTLPPALRAALECFPPTAVREWADGLGQDTFVGSSGRVFPAAHRAAPLLRAWLGRLGELGVELRPRHRWTGWDGDELRFTASAGGVAESSTAEVRVAADATVIAVGGASWPSVGSAGEWTEGVRADGIAVAPLRPSNCGLKVAWSAVFLDRFEGTPVKNVSASGAGLAVRGELVVTRSGLEGGPVYALSGPLGEAAVFPAVVHLDLSPDLDEAALVARLERRRPKASQSTWLRDAGLAPVVVGLLREATGNRLPDDPLAMARLLRAAPIAVEALSPLDRAISTAGGVRFDQLDDGLMLRARPGVFIAGEMLDWDAPTGGYLLQACFATGRLAGLRAAAHLGLAG